MFKIVTRQENLYECDSSSTGRTFDRSGWPWVTRFIANRNRNGAKSVAKTMAVTMAE